MRALVPNAIGHAAASQQESPARSPWLPWAVGVFIATIVLGSALLLLTAINRLDDATRATGELAEIRTFASDVAVAAHEAQLGAGSARLESTILAAEARSHEITRFVEDSLGSMMTDALLGTMKEAWFTGADTARAYVAGDQAYGAVVADAQATAAKVDALIDAIAHERERSTAQLRSILRGAIVAVFAVIAVSIISLIRARRHAALALLRAWLSEERARALAENDPLTGLPLIDHLVARFRETHRSGPFVAMVIDLDRFRRINDAFGADTGDVVLRLLAQRLEARLGMGTVSRRGGEFMALLPDCSDDCLDRLSHDLVALFDQPFESDGQTLWLTASSGLVKGGEHLAPDRALSRASTAALHAKGEGGARTHRCDGACEQDLAGQIELMERLRGAVISGHLEVYYQPQVSLTVGRVTGAEALLRWPQADGGFIPPATFIPLLEEAQLMTTVGEWVLISACRQARIWADAGHAIKVSVNVSPTQLTSDFAETVWRALADADIPAEWIELEITESVAMQAGQRLSSTLEQLMATGVTVALDDFGTGFSSLTHLRSVPASTIKLDRAFVSGLGSDAADTAIVAGVIEVAHQTGRSVVAEGVETEGQVAVLTALGCDTVQGYLFGRPVPAAYFSFEPRATIRLAA